MSTTSRPISAGTRALVLALGLAAAWQGSSHGQRVSNLELEPELRAVRATWSYSAHSPATFVVSYCELTSWNAEIKCKQRDVDAAHHATPVIQPGPGGIQVGQIYEAKIEDLRALTNYTFRVQPARVGRRLDSTSGEFGGAELPPFARVQTKPFSAELVRCLPDASEVLVHTGPYFGGRLTVEGSSGTCQLAGNRSSAQPSYLLRIDHSACASRLVSGERVESTILIHEHRDILTHSTARFHVQCRYGPQQPVTVQAALGATSSPAGSGVPDMRPTGPPTAVSLGSMPGVYRAKPVDGSAPRMAKLLDTGATSGLGPDAAASASAPVATLATAQDSRAAPSSQSSIPPQAVAPPPVQVRSRPLVVRGAEAERLERRRSAPAEIEEINEIMETPITLTNNHRASVQPRLSGAAGSRTGRARPLSRMGDTEPESSEPIATEPSLALEAGERADAQTIPPMVSGGLAHNITSHLLKWSLRALTGLARKSLESLAEEPEDIDTGASKLGSTTRAVDSTPRVAMLGNSVKTQTPVSTPSGPEPTPPTTTSFPTTVTPSLSVSRKDYGFANQQSSDERKEARFGLGWGACGAAVVGALVLAGALVACLADGWSMGRARQHQCLTPNVRLHQPAGDLTWPRGYGKLEGLAAAASSTVVASRVGGSFDSPSATAPSTLERDCKHSEFTSSQRVLVGSAGESFA